jgi:hypothetical protein
LPASIGDRVRRVLSIRTAGIFRLSKPRAECTSVDAWYLPVRDNRRRTWRGRLARSFIFLFTFVLCEIDRKRTDAENTDDADKAIHIWLLMPLFELIAYFSLREIIR